jgi:hypothetical protein
MPYGVPFLLTCSNCMNKQKTRILKNDQYPGFYL